MGQRETEDMVGPRVRLVPGIVLEGPGPFTLLYLGSTTSGKWVQLGVA